MDSTHVSDKAPSRPRLTYPNDSPESPLIWFEIKIKISCCKMIQNRNRNSKYKRFQFTILIQLITNLTQYCLLIGCPMSIHAGSTNFVARVWLWAGECKYILFINNNMQTYFTEDHNVAVLAHTFVLASNACNARKMHANTQCRRQDLLQGRRSWRLCHGALTVDFRAGCNSCSMTNSFVTNAVLIERAVSCWHLHQLISQTTQYLDSWLSCQVYSKVN